MSKLEEKLAASLGPARKPASTRKAPARKAAPATKAPPSETPAAAAPAAADLNSRIRPLHPRRIWPD